MKSSVSNNIVVSSAATSQSGGAIDTEFMLYVSAQAAVTGTSTGTLKLQASNDLPPSLATNSNGTQIPVNWSDIPNATIAIAGAGVYLIPQTLICYRYIRSVFVAGNTAAGTITVNTNIQGA